MCVCLDCDFFWSVKHNTFILERKQRIMNKIGREETAQCQHCAVDLDAVQHTLEECPAWASERVVIVDQIRGDFSTPVI